MTWKRAGMMSSRSLGRRENGPPDHFLILLHLANLHHLGAAAGADLVPGLDHLFDAGQMVWQMTKIALGRRSLGGAIGIGRHHGITSGLGFSNSGLKVFEGQLTFIGVQLL